MIRAFDEERDLVISKNYWENSWLSLARNRGQITVNDKLYLILPPEDDLVRSDVAHAYVTLGRDSFIELLRDKMSASTIRAVAAAYEQSKQADRKAKIDEFNKRQQTLQFETEGD